MMDKSLLSMSQVPNNKPMIHYSLSMKHTPTPKHFVLLLVVFMLHVFDARSFNLSSGKYQSKPEMTNIPRWISSFGITPEENLLLHGHLFSKSAGTSVAIDEDYLGFGSVISPPWFCYPFAAQLRLFNEPVRVEKFNWYPPGTEITGTTVNGISSSMWIVPMHGTQGLLVTVALKNTLPVEIKSTVEWRMIGRTGISRNWEWYPPFAMNTSSAIIHTEIRKNLLLFSNDSVITLIKCPELKADPENPGSFYEEIRFQPGETKHINLVLVIGNDEVKLEEVADRSLLKPDQTIDLAFTASEELLSAINLKCPQLNDGSLELERFYRKGLLTLLSCRWEVPEFIMSPWYAESGIDGGALNNYYWGMAYIGRLMSLIDPAALRNMLIAYISADPSSSYSLNPSDGKGMGVMYSYNYYSIARITHDYVAMTGDTGLLNEHIGEVTYLDKIYHFCFSPENLAQDPELLDFGENHNLLELRKTSDYSHFTPSPNAERLLIYSYFTDFYDWLGLDLPVDFETRSAKLRAIIRSKLWNSEKKWMNSLDSEHKPTTAYSVQIFDVLRTGALDPPRQDALVTHLNTGEFLTPWGILSLSAKDEGYDPTDVDWGGPGIYAGDAPELIEDLLMNGFTDQGIDLLQRILWWGEFPYYPQAIRADRKGYREDGRPNVIAGLATTQMVIFGLFGITVKESHLIIKPIKHSFVQGLKLNNLNIRNCNVDISIHTKKPRFTVQSGGRKYTAPLGNEITIPLPRFKEGVPGYQNPLISY